MSVIVTDARYRMSLSVIRSLGQAGLRVIAQEERGISSIDALGFHSRHVAEKALTASPAQDSVAFIDDLLRLGEDGDVLIPVSLASIFAVASRIDDVRRRFSVALPPIDVIRTANDTDRLLQVASRIGLRVPRTELPVSGDDLSKILPNLTFPVVVKYREGEALGLPPDRRYAIVREKDKFAETYRAMAARQASPLVQEYISGDGWGMSAVMDARSEPALVFCHRRLREYPVTGGPSCFCESVRDQHLIDVGLRLLKELKWHGVAMVEFKREFATGDYDAVKRELERDPASLNGQIIFQKDGYNMSKQSPIVDALPRQLELLRSFGYRVVTVSELLDISPFTDVSPSAPYFAAVRSLARAGYRVAFRDNSFKPERPISGDEAAALLDGPWPQELSGRGRLPAGSMGRTGTVSAKEIAGVLGKGQEQGRDRLLSLLPSGSDPDRPLSRGWAAQMAARALDIL